MLLSFFSHLLKSPRKRWSISLHPTFASVFGDVLSGRTPVHIYRDLEKLKKNPTVKALETSNVSNDY